VRPRTGQKLERPARHAAWRCGAPDAQYLAQGACQAIEEAVVLREALRHTRDDIAAAFQKYQQARYLRTGRVQLTARFYGDIYHASGVQRELRNQMF